MRNFGVERENEFYFLTVSGVTLFFLLLGQMILTLSRLSRYLKYFYKLLLP